MSSANTETVRLLDAVSAAHGHCSDYRIARLLNVTTNYTSGWRKGRHLSDDYASRLAELAGLDPVESVLRVAAERESGVTADVMRKALARLSHAASILLAVMLGVMSAGWPGGPAKIGFSAPAPYSAAAHVRGVGYILRKIARLGLSRLGAALARVLPDFTAAPALKVS